MFVRILPLLLLAAIFAAAQQPSSKWAEVDKNLGRSGQESDGVYKVSFPRSDLDVHIGATKLETGAALGGWAAFNGTGNGVVTDGDLVITSDELGGVVSALQEHQLEVTGIHNHLAGETPAVYYVHFFGRGTAGQLSSAVDAALKATKTPRGPSPPAAAANITYDRATIEKVLGKQGQAKGKVLAFSFPRSHKITMHQQELPPPMGMATGINFQPSAKGVGATGDFVVDEAQVQAVVHALREHNILVTALHNHLLDDSPRMVFIHFWAEGSASDVAQGLKAALDANQ
jgi:Domain of Unknown Function (DUF1259)